MNQTDRMPAPLADDDILPILNDITKMLGTGLNDIEPGFETLGMTLQAVYAEAEGLTSEISALANNMTAGEKDSLLSYIENLVDESLSVLTGCRSAITGSLDSITAGAGHLSELSTICEKMKKSAYFLNIIGLNISVESSRTKDAVTMFGNFGEEIKDLAGNIGKISTTIHKDSITVQADQGNVHRDITAGMKRFDALSDSTQDAVESARKKMASIGNLAAMTLEKAGDHSRTISKIVGEIVMSIQFHDIARQQVEHIISAVEDILSLLEEEADTVKKGRAYSILALQAAQLNQVVAEAETIFQNMGEAFGQIGDEISLLMENVAVSESEKIQGMDLECEVKNFQTKLERLQDLLTGGSELEEKIKTTMDRSSKAVSTLAQFTDQVSNINIDLQYKAINAMIMTDKLGREGATLGVLARNVRDLSAKSNTQVKEILGVIAAITALAAVSGTDAGSPMENTNDIRSVDTALAKGSGLISKAFEQYKLTCTHAGEKAVGIMDTLKETKDNLDFFQAWIQGAAQVGERLDGLLEALVDWKAPAEELGPDGDDEIAQRYTMESERRIHEKLTGAGDASDEEPVSSDTGEDDELDDNIELF